MVAAKNRNFHIGGVQQPLFVPESNWVAPTSLPDLSSFGEIALDTETRDDGLAAGKGPGWVHGNGWICGVSAAWDGGCIYIPLRHPETDCFDKTLVGKWLEKLFQQRTRFVFHNAPYDIGFIRSEWGLLPPEFLDDTTLMAVMLDENRDGYSLDALCKEVGLPGKDETLLREAANAYGFNAKSELWKMPGRYAGPYAEQDAVATLALARHFRPLMEAEGVMGAYQTEIDLIPCTVEMRWRGVACNTERAERGMDELFVMRDNMLVDISHRLARKVTIDNVRSAKWMEGVFTDEGIPFPRTKTGLGSFKNDWMFKSTHWLPRLCAQVEQLTGGAEKFLGGYILNYAHKGRIHASINQFKSDDGGAKTHRVSYSDPPLQQMPSRTKYKDDILTPEIISRIRSCFEPEPGEFWFAPDFSQQEYRLIIHYAYLNGLPTAEAAVGRYIENPRTDYHQMVADMTGLPRPRAKDVNFAKAYGAGLGKFCEMTGMSEEEGLAVMTQYDEEMPFVKALADKVKSLADSRGYIRLIDGARMHYSRYEPSYRESGEAYFAPCPIELAEKRWPRRRLKRAFTHKSMNALIQGSAARQTKKAWVALWKAGIFPLLQIHDEYGISVARNAAGLQLSKDVVDMMTNVIKLRVPVVVDAEFGTHWGNAKYSWDDAIEKFGA